MPKPTTLLTTTEAAARLSLTAGRIRQLARDGSLKGQRVGRDWLFTERDLTAFQRPERGRPRKKEGG